MERLRKKAVWTVVIDSEETETAKQADQFIRLDGDRQFEAICKLRQFVRRRRSVAADSAANPEAGVAGEQKTVAPELDELARLAEQLASAQYAVVVYEPDEDSYGPAAIGQAIVELAGDLHRRTRCAAIRLGRPANAVGAAQALTWQTGYPVAVSFRSGYPEYLPGEACAEWLLARGEVDAALIVGADPHRHYDGAALERLGAIPTIVLDDRQTATTDAATVAIRTARFGVSEAGTVYRSDGVALPLERMAASSAPPAAKVLEAIRERITADG
jgi:formylmethanofuran dehydrogenase subunit B